MYEKMAAQTQIFKILLQGERDIDSGVGYSMEKVMQDATEIEKEWATEADRRQQAVERGESRVLPLESVMREILSGLAQDANAGLESIAAKPSAFDVDGVKTQATMEDISQAIAESRTSNHRDRD